MKKIKWLNIFWRTFNMLDTVPSAKNDNSKQDEVTTSWNLQDSDGVQAIWRKEDKRQEVTGKQRKEGEEEGRRKK